MQFSEHDLRAAVTAGVLDANNLSRLLDFLTTRRSSVPSVATSPAPQFDLAHLLWYAGALIVRELCDDLKIEPLRNFHFSESDIAPTVALAQKASSMRFNPVALPDKALADVLKAGL